MFAHKIMLISRKQKPKTAEIAGAYHHRARPTEWIKTVPTTLGHSCSKQIERLRLLATKPYMKKLKKPNPSPLRILTVQADRLCDDEDLYYEDRNVPEFTDVEVPAYLDDGTAAAAALGAFHSSIPIKRTWDFDFSVTDALTFKEIIPNYELSVCETAAQFNARIL